MAAWDPKKESIFDTDDLYRDDLATALGFTTRLTRLAHLTLDGVLVDAQQNRIEEDDLELLKDVVWVAELYARHAQSLAPQSEPAPDGVIQLRPGKGSA
jgi:hypothetical protein